jgi:hypothetical protein
MNHSLTKSALGAALALAFALCGPAASARQSSSGSLRGEVVDALGGLVVGATVTATDARGVERTVTTDREGAYSINGLAPGTYNVRAAARGFAVSENTIEVSAGRITALNIKLSVALEKQEVTVSNASAVSTDPENNASAVVLRGADLAALPDDAEELADALMALAGPSAGPEGGQIYIDGFSSGHLPQKESIREIRINSNPFSSEYDRIGYGRIEILTKPGTSRFHGQALLHFNNEKLNTRNPFASERAPYRALLFGGTLSGPLAAKRSSFFLNFERRAIDDNSIIAATVLDPALNVISLGLAAPLPRRRTTFSPRLDYQLNKNNTLTARYNFLRSATENAGVGNFSLPSRAYNTLSSEHTVQLSETAVLNERTVNETRFQFIRRRAEQRGDNTVPTVNVLESFVGGGSQVGFSFSDEDRWELQNYTTFALGRHTLRAGVRLRGVRINDVSPSNFGGTFTFGGGTAPQLDANNLIVRDANGNPLLTQITSIERYRRTLLLQRQGLAPAQVRALGGGATQFSINGGNPRASVGQVDFGGFVQDDWRVRPNFTLSAGLRYEAQTNISSRYNFAPRVSFAYAPRAGGKSQTVIRGGAGVFYDRFAETLTLQARRFNGTNEQQFVVINPGTPVPDLPASTFPGVPSVATLAALANPQTTTRVSSDLQAPYLILSALGVEHRLSSKTTLSVTYINARGLHLLRSRDINAPLQGTFTPDVPGSGVRPFGNVGNIFEYESSGRFRQNQLIFTASGRAGRRLNYFANYVLNKASSDTDGPQTFPANSYDLSTEYGRSTSDIRHRLILGGLLNLPWGLSLSPLVTSRSGVPFNIVTGRDTNGDTRFTERPAFATDLTKAGVRVTRFGAFDPTPSPGQSLVPRNFGSGPTFFDVHLRLTKTFGFGGSSRASAKAAPPQDSAPPPGGTREGQAREGGGRASSGGGGGSGGSSGSPFGGEEGGTSTGALTDRPYNFVVSFLAHNLLNHVSFGTPVGNLSSPFFGQSNTLAEGFGFGSRSGSSAAGGTETGNRRIEVQFRFIF